MRKILLLSIFISCIITIQNYPHAKFSNPNNFPATIEIRAYIQNISNIRNKLISLGAVFNGEYACTDYLYQPKYKSFDLDKEYIRLRVYEKSNLES